MWLFIISVFPNREFLYLFFFSSRRRHTRLQGDWSSDVCSSDLRPAVRIQADLARLASYGLSMADLRTAIAAANVSGPKGSLDGRYQFYTISSNDQITNAEAYKEVIVAYRNNAPVLLKDVAEVIDGLENAKVG